MHAVSSQTEMQVVISVPTCFIVLQELGSEPLRLLLLKLTLYICKYASGHGDLVGMVCTCSKSQQVEQSPGNMLACGLNMILGCLHNE